MENKEKTSIFDCIIDKAFVTVKNRTYFTPAGILWKGYLLETESKIEEMKTFLRKFLWLVLIVVLFIFSFDSSISFPLYLGSILVFYFIVILKVNQIKKGK